MADQEGKLESEVREMHLKEEARDADDADMDTVPEAGVKQERSGSGSGDDSQPARAQKASRSPLKSQSAEQSPMSKDEEDEDLVGGEVTLKQEPGKPPRLARSTSHKVERRPPPLFTDYADSTTEATSTFQVIPDCLYANKYLGATDPALECDCAEEWGKSTVPQQVWFRMHTRY